MGAHILEVLPEITRCVSYSPEGVQLRLFIPDGAVLFDMQFDVDARMRSIALVRACGGGRVDVDALLDLLARFAPLQTSVDVTRRLMGAYTTLDINLVAPGVRI